MTLSPVEVPMSRKEEVRLAALDAALCWTWSSRRDPCAPSIVTLSMAATKLRSKQVGSPEHER